jgi:hypothetical protein
VPGRVFSLHIAHFGVRLRELDRIHKDRSMIEIQLL